MCLHWRHTKAGSNQSKKRKLDPVRRLLPSSLSSGLSSCHTPTHRYRPAVSSDLLPLLKVGPHTAPLMSIPAARRLTVIACMQGPLASATDAALQASMARLGRAATSRSTLAQTGIAAAQSGMQPAEPLSSRSASSASLSDSLPEQSITDLLRRPASAPAAAVQTWGLPQGWLHAAVQAAGVMAMPAAAQVPYQAAAPSSAPAPGQDATAQTWWPASMQLPAAAQAEGAAHQVWI